MQDSKYIEQLKAIIKPYINSQEAFDSLSGETDFINDLKVNSANLVDIILDIEEAFDIVIDNAAMEKMLDVKAALSIINTQMEAK